MSQFIPTKIYTLGDYYRDRGLRQACHEIKQGENLAMRSIAMDFVDLFANRPPRGAVLVPVPSLTGYNETFCRVLGYSLGLPVREDLLWRSVEHGSLYALKRQGVVPTEEMTGIRPGRGIPPSEDIILVDNVIATGTTMSAALRAIGRPCDALCIALDYKTFKKANPDITIPTA